MGRTHYTPKLTPGWTLHDKSRGTDRDFTARVDFATAFPSPPQLFAGFSLLDVSLSLMEEILWHIIIFFFFHALH
jgi:hypothetical protein